MNIRKLQSSTYRLLIWWVVNADSGTETNHSISVSWKRLNFFLKVVNLVLHKIFILPNLNCIVCWFPCIWVSIFNLLNAFDCSVYLSLFLIKIICLKHNENANGVILSKYIILTVNYLPIPLWDSCNSTVRLYRLNQQFYLICLLAQSIYSRKCHYIFWRTMSCVKVANLSVEWCKISRGLVKIEG